MESPGEKLIIRLWDTLAVNGVGTLLKPWQMKREAAVQLENRRREIIVIAQAEKEAEEIRKELKSFGGFTSDQRLLQRSGNNLKIENRVEPTLEISSIVDGVMQEMVGDGIRRVVNVSKAVLFAEEDLSRRETFEADQSVESDWIHKWKESVSNVSSEDLQRLWGRLLAEEISKPGTYSLRCMDFIKNLTRNEAHLIEGFSEVCFKTTLGFWGDDSDLELCGYGFDKLLELQHLGVIGGVEAESLNLTFNADDKDAYQEILNVVLILSRNKCLNITHEEKRTLSFKAYFLTRLGLELISLCSTEPNIDFFERFARGLVSEGYKVELASYIDVDNGQIEMDDLTPFGV